MDRPQYKKIVSLAWRQFVQRDLRLSYLIIAGMVVLGALVNLGLPHGWTVWPFVVGAAILLLINEATDRHGQGIPPFHVYVFFASAVALWLTLVAIFSVFNPIILILGILVLGYYALQGHLKQRERARLVVQRMAEGRCIHCGAIVIPEMVYCPRCGEEPNPDSSRLKRVAEVPRTAQSKARTRDALAPKPSAASAAQKERALLSRRHRGKSRRK